MPQINFYAFAPETGEIKVTGFADTKQMLANVGENTPVVLTQSTEVDSDKHFQNLETDELELRPDLGLPEVASGAIAEILDLGFVPSGAEIKIDGVSNGIADGSNVELSFSLDGEYEIEIDPPFPRLKAKIVVTVSP